MGEQQRIVGIHYPGLNTENKYLDAVSAAFRDGFAQFFQTAVPVRVNDGRQRGLAEVLKFNGEPQGIDTVMRDAVEVFVRIVVDVVEEFVFILRRPFDWPEKTSGNAGVNKRGALKFAQRKKGSLSAQQQVFEKKDAAAKPFRVAGLNTALACLNHKLEALAPVCGSVFGADAVRTVGRQAGFS